MRRWILCANHLVFFIYYKILHFAPATVHLFSEIQSSCCRCWFTNQNMKHSCLYSVMCNLISEYYRLHGIFLKAISLCIDAGPDSDRPFLGCLVGCIIFCWLSFFFIFCFCSLSLAKQRPNQEKSLAPLCFAIYLYHTFLLRIKWPSRLPFRLDMVFSFTPFMADAMFFGFQYRIKYCRYIVYV